MNLGIIGSRRRDSDKDFELVVEKFKIIKSQFEITKIISGHCPKGGDRFAEIIADQFKIPIRLFPADWGLYKYSAGFIRNTDIARDSDILLACVSQDRTGGTEDTIRKFIKFHGEKNIILV